MTAPAVEDLGALLSPAEVSKRTGIKLATLASWRMQQRGPEFIRLGARLVRYPERALNEWLATCERGGGGA